VSSIESAFSPRAVSAFCFGSRGNVELIADWIVRERVWQA
jgi:hypothetical protein